MNTTTWRPGSSSSERVLFFSRGRGRGHALPDLAVLDALERLRPGLDVVFVSYSTGAATLREAGHAVIDLKLPEEAPFLEVLIRAGQVILHMRPGIVVSHEEFAALPAAKLVGARTVFLVDFFPQLELWAQSLLYGDRVVFMERRGIFPEPPPLQGRVRYTGPVIRPISYERRDRLRAREELELPRAAAIVSIIPGSWATEERSPIYDLVIPAFKALAAPEKRLVWAAGRDYEALRDRLDHDEEILVLSDCRPIERLMVASDLVITKANRGTTLEAAHLGVRTVSLSHGRNPIDEAIVLRVRTNTALYVKGVDSAYLAEVLEGLLNGEEGPAHAAPERFEGGAAAAASEIAAFMASRDVRPMVRSGRAVAGLGIEG